MTHGTRYAHQDKGCRCEACRSWRADREREKRARVAAEGGERLTRARALAVARTKAYRGRHAFADVDAFVAAFARRRGL